jgi:DNA-binding PadR family transcriptional regulator
MNNSTHKTKTCVALMVAQILRFWEKEKKRGAQILRFLENNEINDANGTFAAVIKIYKKENRITYMYKKRGARILRYFGETEKQKQAARDILVGGILRKIFSNSCELCKRYLRRRLQT